MPPSKPISELAVDFEKLERTLRLDEVKTAAKEAAALIKADAESRARGSIRDSFLMRVDRAATIDSIEVRIGTDKQHWYARFFDTGTRPHTITAGAFVAHRKRGARSTARVLVNQREGIFFGRTVRHPGMRPVPLLSGAIKSKGQEAALHFSKRLREFVLSSFNAA